MNVLIVVTHLLGTGHLARALTLARAINAAGDRAVVVSGGMPAPQLDRGDVEMVQLPPLRSDGVNFTRLLGDDGTVASEDLHAKRQSALVELIQGTQWDTIITELYPFGRRVLRAEFLAALEAAHGKNPRPLICASVRDILAPPSKPEKAVKADAIIAQYYDAVLVHSDSSVTPLESSWPVTDMLRGRLHYTGFVASPPPTAHPQAAGAGEILVTAGGGDVGGPIFAAALAAAANTDRKWRILLGGGDAARRAADMMRNAPPNVVIEAARPDFSQMLNHAAASVCMCGYNTALDVLQTGCAAVFIPFDAGGEVEQTLRAQALAALDGIDVLRSADLSPATLLAHLDAVMSAPKRSASTKGMRGAARTVEVLHDLHAALT